MCGAIDSVTMAGAGAASEHAMKRRSVRPRGNWRGRFSRASALARTPVKNFLRFNVGDRSGCNNSLYFTSCKNSCDVDTLLEEHEQLRADLRRGQIVETPCSASLEETTLKRHAMSRRRRGV